MKMIHLVKHSIASQIRFVLMSMAVLVITGFVSGCQTMETSNTFKHAGNELAFHYETPKEKTKGIILFVHGDGALPKDAHGYYKPIWKQLINSGYAVFSWDKPGVGGSTGNWLNQSMQDRQNEVHEAIKFVKTTYGYQPSQIGLMGFSQGGWVVPAVAKGNEDVAFIIGVGFAINWVKQGWYLTKVRLEKEGLSQKEIAKARQFWDEEVSVIQSSASYEDYVVNFPKNDFLKPAPKARFTFIKKNLLSDATEDYRGITQPVLMLLGDHDLNVDIQDTQSRLTMLFQHKNNMQMYVVKDATHSLLKHPEFNEQKPGVSFMLNLLRQGEKAFADEFFPYLISWLDGITAVP